MSCLLSVSPGDITVLKLYYYYYYIIIIIDITEKFREQFVILLIRLNVNMVLYYLLIALSWVMCIFSLIILI